MRTYTLIIWPKLDYGSLAYGSASAQILKRLDVIPNEAMSISTEALKTTPIEALHILTNEPPFQFRREKLLLRIYFKFRFYLNNPAYSCIVNRQLEDCFTTRHFNPPSVLRIADALARRSIPTQTVRPFGTPTVYAWELYTPSIDLQYTELSKQQLQPPKFKQYFQETMQSSYLQHYIMYRDDSKSYKGREGSAVISRRKTEK